MQLNRIKQDLHFPSRGVDTVWKLFFKTYIRK